PPFKDESRPTVREAPWSAAAAATAFLSIHGDHSALSPSQESDSEVCCGSCTDLVWGTTGKWWLLPPHSKAASPLETSIVTLRTHGLTLLHFAFCTLPFDLLLLPLNSPPPRPAL